MRRDAEQRLLLEGRQAARRDGKYKQWLTAVRDGKRNASRRIQTALGISRIYFYREKKQTAQAPRHKDRFTKRLGGSDGKATSRGV